MPECGDILDVTPSLLPPEPGITICSSWARLEAAGWPGVGGFPEVGVKGPAWLGVLAGAGDDTGDALGLCAGDCVLGAGEFCEGDI